MSLVKRLSRHRLSLLGFFVALVLALIITCNLRSTNNDERLAAIRKAGYPVTLAELDEWYVRPPDAQNAALIYTNGVALVSSLNSNFTVTAGDITLPKRGQSFSRDDRVALLRIIDSNSVALGLFDRASRLTNARYPVDVRQGINASLPYLAPVKGSVTLLTMTAALRADDGQKTEAYRSLYSAIRLNDSLSQEPVLISQLVRYSCYAIVIPRLEYIENRTSLDEPELASLQAALAHAEAPAAAARALVGERAMGLDCYDNPHSRQSMLFGFSSPLSTNQPAMTDRLKSDASVFVLQALGMFAKDREYYLDTLSTNIFTAALPYPERFTQSRNSANTFNSTPRRLYVFSHMLLPALAKFHSRDAEHTARMRVAQAALAIERYRLAHSNAVPTSLGDLTPTYLAAVLIDPCDGQPLRFKKLEKGYVVYSVGADGKDDGGKERIPGAGANYDITFTVER